MKKPRMQRPYREVGKPFATRTIELLRAIQLVRDSLLHLRVGHVRHLASLSGQLRAILTDKSTAPLLLDVAQQLGTPPAHLLSAGHGRSQCPIRVAKTPARPQRAE